MSRIPNHTDLHSDRNVYHGPYTCLGSPITWTSTLVGMSTRQAVSFCLCCFSQVVRHLWSLDVSGIHRHMTFTLVGTSILPAGSFCLCCFLQVVIHLCSLDVSWIQRHMDLHSSSNVCLSRYLIISRVVAELNLWTHRRSMKTLHGCNFELLFIQNGSFYPKEKKP